MIRAGSGPKACAFALLGALLLGCGARTPVVQSGALKLRRVVVYRNGVAYFERRGQVEADVVKFRVKGKEVGDFLATMAVMERGGSSVRAASFPLKVDKPDDDDELPVFDPDFDVRRPRKKKKYDPNSLVDVLLELDGKQHDLQVGYVAETPVWRPSYRLVVRKDGTAVLQAWGIVQNLSGEDWKNIRLSLVAGAPLAFRPTLGKPIIPPRPVVTDRGEVINAVPMAEVALSRNKNAPSSQPTAMAPPPPPGGGGGKTGLYMDDDEGGASASEPMDKRKRAGRPRPKSRNSRPHRSSAGRGDFGGLLEAEKKAEGKKDSSMPSRLAGAVAGPRDLSALAAVAVEGSTTRYDMPQPVTVPDKSATMVMLLSKAVKGESVYLYAPSGGVGDSMGHPFRVARFRNETPGLLEKGPIAVFEEGAFLGQGMVSSLPAGATTTVPFALERGISVEKSVKYGEEGARIAKIEAGRLYIERDSQTLTTYKVRNGRSDKIKLLLKHPRGYDARLFNAPKGTEDNLATHSALVPIEVGPMVDNKLVVDERRSNTRRISWLSQLADDAVQAYLKHPQRDKAVAQKLKEAWTARTKLKSLIDAEDKIRAERRELERSTSQTRRNLRAIEKNKAAAALRRKLTKRLERDSARLDVLTKQKVEARMKRSAQQVRFREALRTLKLKKGTPAPLK